MSKVSAESGQAAWYGTWPETARGSGNAATLCTAIANCANLQEGFTPQHEPWAQCWHPRLPASLATTRPPCGSSGASHELFWVAPSSFCPLCLRRGAAVLATASRHRRSSPELPRLRQREHGSSFAKATVTLCGWGGDHGGGSSPQWSLTDKDSEDQSVFQALAQCAQDAPPLLPSLPLAYHGQAQRGLGLFHALSWGLRYGMLVYSWLPVGLLVGARWCGSSSTRSLRSLLQPQCLSCTVTSASPLLSWLTKAHKDYHLPCQ